MTETTKESIRKPAGVVNETSTPRNACPLCGYESDVASSATGAHVPQEGDLSVCLNCGNVGQFTADLRVRAMTPEEVADLPAPALQMLARAEDARRRAVGGVIGGLTRKGRR